MKNLKIYSEEIKEQVSEILSRKDKPLHSENILCLGQSENSKGVMFVLYRFNHADASFQTGQDPMRFCCILSEDLLEAAKKARKICGIMDISLDIEHNFKRTKIEVQKRYFAEQYPEIMAKLEIDNFIMSDILRYFNKKGILSQAQLNLIDKIYDKHLEYQEIRREQEANKLKYADLEQFYFTPGDKVELEIEKEIARFGFDSLYGYTTIIKWVTKCGKVVIYSGSSPKDIEEGSKISATIKHHTFRGINQTLLLRIKILN